jgi:hypothetical protein
MSDWNELSRNTAGFARDAAYVAVGLGVLGFQRAQVQRRTLQRRLGATDLDRTLIELRTNVARGVQDVDDLMEQVIGRLESTVAPLEQQLPAPFRQLVDQAHVQAREARGQLRHLVRAAV